ncbi:hypothetical protein SCLCIDRAFT_29585 [Scleroderma citrinum Foug A]|uniref:DUF4100 domain-containing protein n=1 Tax=Scleroderma citrinum Foug A TaxID=1036808 RepID=A0A0C3DK43_9AGAM|nr:hypothetical protein SCLCIDRAFT_29585 [Scleroderma citrinum Foug A]
MSAPAMALSVLTLPLLGMKSAPELFRGDHSQIRTFLDHYEHLCALHNVVDDQEKVNSILQYCSTKVQETIEGMPHFHYANWDELRHDLLKYFDANLSDERFYERDLKEFVVISACKPIHSLISFRTYCRDFICIGGWLRNQGRISEDEFNCYFWAGLPSTFCHPINCHLLLLNPNLDVTWPFPYSDVTKAAEQLLHRDCFGAEYLDLLGVKEKDDFPSPCFDPRSDPVCPLLSPQDARTTLQGLEKAEPTAQKQDEVENLIKTMSRMSLSNPKYSLYYYCAIKLDPDASKVIHPPALHSSSTPSSATAPTARPHSPGYSITCYGCGVEGHGVNSCDKVNDLITKGLLSRDETHCVTLPNGQCLFRNGDETILQAYGCHSAAARTASSVRFVTHAEEELELGIYELEDEEFLTAAADCAPRITKEKRKAAFDGVIIPPHGKGKGKENQPPAATPAPKPVPLTSVYPPAPIPMPVPINVHPHVFDGSNNDAIMQDDTLPVKSSNSPSDSTEKKKSKPPAAMSSSLSQNTNAKGIVDCILATPFTLSVGEVIGSSKDISQQLQDLIRINPLITAHFLCNGQLVKAIIDSGSTLNIVRASIAKTVVKMPIDTSKIMHMKDANDDTSKLLGLIQNVPLFCGAAKTWTHIYVSPDNDSGFDLLLGHPWAQGNAVSIMERDSGTYVVFGADSDHPLEMCVAKPCSCHPDSGTGLLATLEPEGKAEEEEASSVLHPFIPEAPDIASSLSVTTMIPTLQVPTASCPPTSLLHPGLPAHISLPPPFVTIPLTPPPVLSPDPLLPPSIASSISTPSNPRITLDEALQVVAEHIEASGTTVLD